MRALHLLLAGTALFAAAVLPVAPALAAELMADVVVYETSETITPPTRMAPLLGSAKITSPLCRAVVALGLGGATCTITGAGSADVPTGANVAGTLAVVVEGSALGVGNTNTADVAEVVVTAATFGAPGIVPLPLPAGTPKGLRKTLEALQETGVFVLQRIDGSVVIDYGADLCTFFGLCPVTVSFRGTFRLPFALRRNGQGGDNDPVEKPRRGKPAFYLSDTGKLLPVLPEERAVGYPTPRLEVIFTP